MVTNGVIGRGRKGVWWAVAGDVEMRGGCGCVDEKGAADVCIDAEKF